MTNEHDESKPVWKININDEEHAEISVVEDLNNDDTTLYIHYDSALVDKILNEPKLEIPKSKIKQNQISSQSNSNSDINIKEKTNKSTMYDSVSNNGQSTTTVRKEDQRP
ncbi:unnamed protein product, partial [Rotaria magnacalcarata]